MTKGCLCGTLTKETSLLHPIKVGGGSERGKKEGAIGLVKKKNYRISSVLFLRQELRKSATKTRVVPHMKRRGQKRSGAARVPTGVTQGIRKLNKY